VEASLHAAAQDAKKQVRKMQKGMKKENKEKRRVV